MTKKPAPKLKDLPKIVSNLPKLGKDADRFARDSAGSPHETSEEAVHEKAKKLPNESFVDFMRRSPLYGVDIDLDRVTEAMKKGDIKSKQDRTGKQMEILSQKTTKVVNMAVEFAEDEHAALYQHAKKNIPAKALTDFMISWAVADILRKYIDKLDKQLPPKKEKKASKAAKVYHDLDHLAGTWDKKAAKEFKKNTKDFEKKK